jgi:hypothetical protein
MKFLFVWFVPLSLLAAACVPADRPPPLASSVRGSGHVLSEDRLVAGFRDVIFEGVGSLTITLGPTEALTIEAEDNLLPLLYSQVRGTRLVLEQAQPITPTRPIRYILSAARLDNLRVAGGADVTVSGVTTDTLDVEMRGAGTVRVSGNVRSQFLSIAGAGRYVGDGLTSREADVTIDGAGSAVVNASEYLQATVNGLGTIEYIGSPRVQQSINGLGTVRRVGSSGPSR